MDSSPVVSKCTYPVQASRLWAAITDPSEMKRWFFAAMTDFRAEVGFETRFVVHHEGVDYVHHWTILEVEPESKIVYGWQYDGVPGDSSVTFEITEATGGTTLTVTHRVIEPFPQDNPVFSREAGQGGWDYFVKGTLNDYLAS